MLILNYASSPKYSPKIRLDLIYKLNLKMLNLVNSTQNSIT